jgi:hypothetical protein
MSSISAGLLGLHRRELMTWENRAIFNMAGLIPSTVYLHVGQIPK